MKSIENWIDDNAVGARKLKRGVWIMSDEDAAMLTLLFDNRVW